MSAGWALSRYGFGAARLALRPEPYRGAQAGLRELAPAPLGRAPTLAGTACALLLGAWLVAAALRDEPVESALEIVRFELPAPVEPEPPPIAEPEPPAIAKPEPVLVAARPSPPPPIAKPAPEPAPTARPARAPRPAPIAAPAPPPPVTVPAPRPPVVASLPAAPRPTLRIDAVAAPAAPPASAPRRLQSAATRPAAPRAAAPSFDLGAPALAAPAAQDTLASTPAPRAAAPARAGTGTRASPRPPASLAVPALASAPGDFGLEATPVHVAVRGDAARAVAARAHEPKLRGVPLGSLASCVSDREEDALKQQLVALVGGPSECVSAAGRYRFVETRNLNAFLLWVERAPQRAAADRCVELSFALECVRRRGGGEWKQG